MALHKSYFMYQKMIVIVDTAVITDDHIEGINGSKYEDLSQFYNTHNLTAGQGVSVYSLEDARNELNQCMGNPDRYILFIVEKDQSFGIFHCCKCGGKDIYKKEWTHANTGQVYWGQIDEASHLTDAWCETCQDHTEIEYTAQP